MNDCVSTTYFVLRSRSMAANPGRYVGLVRNGAHLLVHNQRSARRFSSIEAAQCYAGKTKQILGEFDVEMRTAL